MKIKTISLNNVGPYLFDVIRFNVENANKNISLIGGKNGAGKTTLFNAVKICLYGAKTFGYESINTYYLEEVAKLINKKLKLNKNGNANVVIELLMDDGMNDFTYRLDRSWAIVGNKIKENFMVYKQDVPLSDKEKADFANYLFQLIPPDLFKFYFFDGERISDFIFNKRNNDFKNAFLRLCGLDTLEIIKNNFRRVYKSGGAKNSILKDYEKLLSEKEALLKKIEEITQKRTSLNSSIMDIDDQLAYIEKDYYNAGGIDKATWDGMQEQLKKEESFRDERRRWLKDIANNVLPFIILRKEIAALKDQILLEDKIHSQIIIKKELDSPKLSAKILKIFKDLRIEYADDLTIKVLAEISNEIIRSDINDGVEFLALSKKEQSELLSKVNSFVAFDVDRIHEATKEIKNSTKTTRKIREKLERSSIADYDQFLNKKNELLNEKNQQMNIVLDVERTLMELKNCELLLDNEIKKAKGKYEAELKEKSVQDISAKALGAFEELQSKLYFDFIKDVENNFLESFSSLINKNTLLDGIYINEELSVFPYKNKKFTRAEVISLIQKHGEDYVLETVGKRAYEILDEQLKTKSEIIELPIEIQQEFSAGEKQIFIMALYQALVNLNKIGVPYIIDTPFARIDREHRKKILQSFFFKLKGQVIILSTDEEIIGDYKETIAPKLAGIYLLEHDQSDGSSRITTNAYFGGDK